MAPSGALSPPDAARELFDVGLHHLYQPTQLTFLKNAFGGLLFGYAGLFATIVSAGSPALRESAPGIVRLLQGMSFPAGLVITYFVGGELFTGYPMWMTMVGLQRKGRPAQYVKGFVASWIGNLVGTLMAAAFFSYFTESISEEPYRSGLVDQVTNDIVRAKWHVIFLKALACGHLVSLAMFFGTQNQDGVSKAIGLYLPFLLATTARYPHTVEYMYLALAAMLYGAPLSIGGFFWKCMLPITLGNTIGGSLLTGLYNWWVYFYCEDGHTSKTRIRLLDGDYDEED